MPNFLHLHELQHTRLPCPSPTPGACSNSCPSSRWCHPAISFSVIPFSCLQSFPALASFPINLFLTSGGQSTGASASVFPMNIQDWFPLGLTRFELLAVQGTLKNLLQHQSSVQFSCSVRSDSLRPHDPQHTRAPCPSPTPRVYPNPCPLSWWCHPPISSSVVPFSSCPQSFPVSGSFPVNQLFASGSQSIGVSALASVLPMNTQDWSPLGWAGWISLQSKGLSRGFSNPTVQKHQFFCTQLSSWSNSHIHTWLLEKP